MAERTIRILRFLYTDDDGNQLAARQGQTLDFSDEDTARGDADGAFVTEETAEEAAAVVSMESTDDDLVAFAKDAKVSEVVEAAGDDPELAQRLLDAESAATGGEPRKTVAEGLAAVVGSA